MKAKTKANERVSEELLSTLNNLRWVLTGYKLSGVESWPARRAVGRSEQTEPSQPRDLCDPCEGWAPGEPDTEGGLRNLEDICGSHGTARPEEPGHGAGKSSQLASIREELGECRRCRLNSDRTRIVFGEGAPGSELVFVGEGPGFDEDRQGRPFVGRAGKLLNGMIRALDMDRDEVYICNVVKCRPPGNRTPNPDEIEVCSKFLFQQLSVIQPRVICALGACAAQTLLGSTDAISRLRGRVHRWRGTPLICTYHPAYLLRNPAQKVAVWQDLLQVRRLLGSGRPPT